MTKKQKEDNKTVSIFRLLGYLIRGNGYTIKHLSEKLNIPTRTMRRYLDEELNDMGFIVEKDSKTKVYKISDKNVPLQLSYGFNQIEIDFLKEILLAHGTHSIAESIMNKVLEKMEKERFAENIANITDIEVLRKLTKAMQERKKVILEDYYSIESQTVKNREVEPLAFVQRFTQVRCYEKSKDMVVSFNVRRIRNVKILEQPQTYQGEVSPTDPFGLTEKEEIYIELELSKKAYFLLQDEYPLSQKYLKQDNGIFFYKGFVRSFKGIGRFLLSLPGEIKILHPTSLQEFLQEEIKKFGF
jgi:predicted DNA-binding transcriptional regulator YafY